MTGMLQWGNLHGSSTSLLLAELLKSYEGPILVITDSSERLEQLKNNLSFFNTTSLPSFSFPGYETLPYDHFSPSENILSERLLGLYRLSSLTRGMVLTAMPTLMSRLMPKQYLQGQVFAIQVGETIPLESFKRRLVETGYLKVSQVLGHGEFAIHGSILDLFPMGSKMPFRIEFFDEESICAFQPSGQSIEYYVAEQIDPDRRICHVARPLYIDLEPQVVDWRWTYGSNSGVAVPR